MDHGVHPGEDDEDGGGCDSLMEAEGPSSTGLSTAYPASSVSDANDYGENQNAVGK